MRATCAPNLGRVRRRRPGNPGDGDVINEARTIGENGRQALGVRRRRGQPDEVQSGFPRRWAELLVLFRRHIDHDKTIHPGCCRIFKEAATGYTYMGL